MGTPYIPPNVVFVRPMPERHVWVVYENGLAADVDLMPLLDGPAFDLVRSHDTIFSRAFVEFGTICWPDGTDIAPELLHEATLNSVKNSGTKANQSASPVPVD